VRIEFVSKSSMLYENRGPIAFYVNDAVIVSTDIIRPLPKVDVVETIMVRTDEGGLGGGMPSVLVVIEGV
jgi:hypothetical protein